MHIHFGQIRYAQYMSGATVGARDSTIHRYALFKIKEGEMCISGNI